ncbi:MAG: hypothetical protein IKN43_14250 [Selenomonadaceae bacterium]|nr:hypothetical protein [Selenomonadaceae bacterium]
MDCIEKLCHANNIWIYGAGVFARRVLYFFKMPYFIKIRGIVVTDKKNNADSLEGYKICAIDEIEKTNFPLFIIAVSDKYKNDVVQELQSRGFDNYIFLEETFWRRIWELTNYKFIDRRKRKDKVCFVLSGYKEFLWEDVFERLCRVVPRDIEICILSSGVWSDDLADLAEQNDWSYLSTSMNSVTLIQNIAIRLYPYVKWIYKMDEDIFLTKHTFERIMNAYLTAELESRYEIGFAGPLLPLNGYGYIPFLKHLGKLNEYDRRFEYAFFGGSRRRMVECCDEVAGYLWGLASDIPQLDILGELFGKNKKKYSFCNVRFSIGFILFKRSFWESFNGFDVSGQRDLGVDEGKLGEFCINNSYAIVVAEDTVVGHFSFGQQTEYMKKLYENNREWFAMPKEV